VIASARGPAPLAGAGPFAYGRRPVAIVCRSPLPAASARASLLPGPACCPGQPAARVHLVENKVVALLCALRTRLWLPLRVENNVVVPDRGFSNHNLVLNLEW